VNDNDPESKVIRLVTAKQRMNQSTIEVLEHYLELARKGTVAEIALVAILSDGDFDTVFSPRGHVLPILGAVTALQSKLCTHLQHREPDDSPSSDPSAP